MANGDPAPSLLNTPLDPDPDTAYLQALGAQGGGGGIDLTKAAQLLSKNLGGVGGSSAGAQGASRRMPPAFMPLTSLNRPLPQAPVAPTDSGDQQALIAQLSDAIRRAQAANTLSNQPQR
jgi:hypothetical protein